MTLFAQEVQGCPMIEYAMDDGKKGGPSNTAPRAFVRRYAGHPRDAPISLQIGTAEDIGASPSEFLKLGEGRLAVIVGKAIFEVILPDDVDPARKNPAIRAVNQRLLAYGSDDELVSRISA